MTSPLLSRRGLLCGAAAMALAGCAGQERAVEVVPAPSNRVLAGRVEEVMAALDAALHEPDIARFLSLAGARTDADAWRRIHAGLHTVPMAEYRLDLAPHQLNRAALAAAGPWERPLTMRLAHRIDGVDLVASLQSGTLTLRRERPAGPVEVVGLALPEDHTRQPWELVDLQVATSERVVLQFQTSDADVAIAALPAIDRGVGRAYGVVPDARSGHRQSVLWAWGDDAAHNAEQVYGGRVVVDAAGVCFRIEAEQALSVNRIMLVRHPDDTDADVERVSAHETVHSLASTWPGTGPTRGMTWFVEGLASWVEYGFWEGLQAFRWRIVLDHLDEAVATRLWADDFYAGDAGMHYHCATVWFGWLEEQLGRERVWQLAQEVYRGRGPRTVAETLGIPEDELFTRFATWVRSR